jgi:hypothetical protein
MASAVRRQCSFLSIARSERVRHGLALCDQCQPHGKGRTYSRGVNQVTPSLPKGRRQRYDSIASTAAQGILFYSPSRSVSSEHDYRGVKIKVYFIMAVIKLALRIDHY